MRQILVMNTVMPEGNILGGELAVISITPNGNRLAQQLATLRACDCYTSDKLITSEKQMQSGFRSFNGTFSECVERLFDSYSALLFICATGIVVRTIAPLITNKLADPAVMVMDERGKHIISLLSGHVGGANQLTLELAELINAEPVITTATDVNEVAALDMIAKSINADVVDYRHSVKLINQMLVSGKRVGIYQQHAVVDDLRGVIVVDDLAQLPDLDALVWISMADELPEVRDANGLHLSVIQVVPRRIVAGIGCRRGTHCEAIHTLLFQQLKDSHITPLALYAIGSVDIKYDEQGLIQLTEQLKVPFQLYSVQQLAPYEHHFPESEFVKKTLGIGSVSQPVAWLMSQGNLCGDTLKQQGITITLGVIPCCM